MLEQDPENARLRRQQMLLPRASISTIDSFCSDVVKENFYKLNISPNFTIGDEGQQKLFKNQAAQDVLDEAYENGSEAFFHLVETFSDNRSDNGLAELIKQVYDYTRAYPFPEKWMRDTAALYQTDAPLGETPWGRVIQRETEGQLHRCMALTHSALRLAEQDAKILEKRAPAFHSDLALYQRTLEFCEKNDWNGLCETVQQAEFIRFKQLRGYTGDPLVNRIGELRERAKKETYGKIKEHLCTEEEGQEDIRRHRELIGELFRLTRRFIQRLDEIKAEHHVAFFSDLTHWTLQLLWEERDGEYVKTEEAELISRRFDEIVVDEYQDTNEAQDRIFQAISRDEQNLFFVGDVKQSIYGFRQAMPRLFLRRRASYADYDRKTDRYPARIDLDRNFRSRSSVTDTVNYLFGQLMSEEAGDVDYNEREALVAEAEYAAQEGVETELLILEQDRAAGDLADEKMEVLEAEQIARRIHEMMAEGFLIKEGETQRPVTYGDFAVLLRSANRYMPQYVKTLAEAGIPAVSGKSPGFFKTAEVAVMLSLLRIISNPIQDIPLLSVLVSPLYGFTPDDLTKIRVSADRKLPLYLALRKAAENLEPADAFLRDLEEYRAMAATLPTDKLLRYIYGKTGYCSLVQAMEFGERRLMNLQLLLEYARNYESSGYHGAAGFVRFVDRLQEQKDDLPAAETPEGAENAVRIMSVHNSKGLEFPVCFVAGCSRKFTPQKETTLFSQTLGIGTKLYEEGTSCRYDSLMKNAVSVEKKRDEISEELRVYYVALTRAKEKLILLMTEKDLDSRLDKLGSNLGENEKMDSFSVNDAKSASDWFLSCALRHPDGAKLRERAGLHIPVLQNKYASRWKISLLIPETEAAEETEVSREQILPDPELLQMLRRRMDYRYPYEEVLDVPAKVTASALSEEEAKSFAPIRSLPRPSFLSKKGLTPAERGTATHEFLQFCSFEHAREDFAKEVERLVEGGFLSPRQGEAVDENSVSSFFASDLARRMENASDLEREYRFTVEIPARYVKEELSEETEQTVVLQGAVDCVFEEDGELVIVDYKTDRIKDGAALWERYQKQIQLYAMAMEQCTGKRVKETMLYSFALNCIVKGE